MTVPDRSDFIAVPGGARAVQIDETRDLQRFRRVMQPVPQRIVEALERGVDERAARYLTDPNLLLEASNGRDGLVDDVLRQPDGSLVVACRTDMPGVSAAMWDWWFSWHSYASRRYRLWHPEDHLAAAMAEDRRHVLSRRERWVGNTSYVDELVGGDMSRLAIHFLEPETVGLDSERVDRLGLAICARISTRKERLAVGRLIHYVENTRDGAVMYSRFHLGDGASELPGVGAVVDRVVNNPRLRRRLLPDEFGHALMFHCAQEMNHLSAILPELYEEFGHE